jgi:chromosome segregation ATPase
MGNACAYAAHGQDQRDSMGRAYRSAPKDQLQTVKEEADGEISDAEATRRIFDRAARAQELEQELRDYEQEVSDIRAELGQERARRDEAVAQTREKYENEIEYLQNQIDRLQRTNLKILEQREENTDLQVYVDERREWEQASWFTRQKWKLFGKD